MGEAGKQRCLIRATWQQSVYIYVCTYITIKPNRQNTCFSHVERRSSWPAQDVFDEGFVSLNRRLQIANGQRFMVGVCHEDVAGAVQVSRVVAGQVRYVGAVVDGDVVKACVLRVSGRDAQTSLRKKCEGLAVLTVHVAVTLHGSVAVAAAGQAETRRGQWP